jgi:hypothetical protein
MNKVNALVLEPETFPYVFWASQEHGQEQPGGSTVLMRRKGLTEDKGYNLETVQNKSHF